MEDEGFNSMEDSNHSFFGKTPDNEISDSSLIGTFPNSGPISRRESSDSSSSLDSIEHFLQQQREIREKFGGILEEQISRLKSKFEPEFPRRKSFIDDSTQTPEVNNKHIVSLSRNVLFSLTFVEDKIKNDNRSDRNWTKSLEEIYSNLHNLYQKITTDEIENTWSSASETQYHVLLQYQLRKLILSLDRKLAFETDRQTPQPSTIVSITDKGEKSMDYTNTRGRNNIEERDFPENDYKQGDDLWHYSDIGDINTRRYSLSELVSDEDMSFIEMVNTFYTDNESPLRKSLSDELEEYFREHPDSPKLTNTQLALHLPDSTEYSYQHTLEGSQFTNNKSEKSAYTDIGEKDNTRTENSVEGFNLLPYDFSQNLNKGLEYTTDTDTPNLNECDEEFIRDWLGKEKEILVYSPNDEDKLKSGTCLKPREYEISSTQESTTSSSQHPESSSSLTQESATSSSQYPESSSSLTQEYSSSSSPHQESSSSSSSLETSSSSSSANYASISHNDGSSLFQDNSDKTIGMSYQYLSSYDLNYQFKSSGFQLAGNDSLFFVNSKPFSSYMQSSEQHETVQNTVDELCYTEEAERNEPKNRGKSINIPNISSSILSEATSTVSKENNLIPEISYGTTRRWNVVTSGSDPNLCSRSTTSECSVSKDMTNTDDIITPTPDKGKVSRLIRWIFFGLIVFILCVSQIRRTNENGDIRDFSLVDDLSKLVQLKNSG